MALETARGGTLFGSPVEFVVIAAVIVLLFGSKVFVSWAKGLGETIAETKKIRKEIEDE